MADVFLGLPASDRREVLGVAANRSGRPAHLLEKDVWVVWALSVLYGSALGEHLAFKGGTSLSKVFGAIARFSEDVDITLDYRGLGQSFDPFAEGVTRNRLKKFSEELKSFVRDHVHDVVEPYFRRALASEFDGNRYQLEVSDDGEQMRVHYRTVMGKPGDYVGNSVLIEFGGRNITEPNEEHEVHPDIAEYVEELDFPRSTVSVLSPARTFWEKATLIHVECQREEFRVSADRLSRHWYDLAMLADLAHGKAAVADRDLLADVVKHKKVFYHASYANYEACMTGQIALIPEKAALVSLHDDFQRMIGAGMFIGEPPTFDAIVDLELEINTI